MTLFEPNVDLQKEYEFLTEEVVVDPDLDHHVCVMIKNDKGYPVKLKKGSVLGTVVTVKEVKQENDEDEIPENVADPSDCVASIQAVVDPHPSKREEQLLKTLYVNRGEFNQRRSDKIGGTSTRVC